MGTMCILKCHKVPAKDPTHLHINAVVVSLLSVFLNWIHLITAWILDPGLGLEGKEGFNFTKQKFLMSNFQTKFEKVIFI